MSQSQRNSDGWTPRTRLGRMVQDGDVTSMEQALNSGLPLKEPELVDQLLPGLDDEVLDGREHPMESGGRAKTPQLRVRPKHRQAIWASRR